MFWVARFAQEQAPLSGSQVDYGINDDFVKSLAETIPPNSSALFILVRKVQPEKVLVELSGRKGPAHPPVTGTGKKASGNP